MLQRHLQCHQGDSAEHPAPYGTGYDAGMSPFLALALVLVIGVAGAFSLIVLGNWRRVTRSNTVRRWAKRYELTFENEGGTLLHRHFRDAWFFRHEAQSCFQNVCRGQIQSRDLIAADYGAMIHRDVRPWHVRFPKIMGFYFIAPKSIHCRVTVIIVRGVARLPSVLLRPEGWIDRLSKPIGHRCCDIRIGHEAFDRRFLIAATDEKSARTLLTQRMREFLLGQPRYCIEFYNDCVIVWRDDLLGPKELDSAVSLATGIHDRLRIGD
jgi:hypothetical protein